MSVISNSPRIDEIRVATRTLATEAPESDGTLSWNKTIMVLVEARSGGVHGLGYTYADKATAQLIVQSLYDVVVGRAAMDVTAAYESMVVSVRDLGRGGIAAMAISAVDLALWDLKARLLELPLVQLLGATREQAPVYGSGGFTSLAIDRLQDQLGGWARAGFRMVKMKVGRNPEKDVARVRAARGAIGPDVELFVDADGAYERKQALEFSRAFRRFGVTWFEEPVAQGDLDGLRLMRDRAPAGMEIAAGVSCYALEDVRALLESGAVDVLQADLTRCGGITGFLRTATLCQAHHVPLSAHSAPALHAHLACVVPALRHVEYSFDHARFESLIFDGLPSLGDGMLRPDFSRAGMGLSLKAEEAARLRFSVGTTVQSTLAEQIAQQRSEPASTTPPEARH